MRRRTVLEALGVSGTGLLAGCGGNVTLTPTEESALADGDTATDTPASGGDGTPTDTPASGGDGTETPTQTEPSTRVGEAVVGELVEGDQLSMVVRKTRRTTDLGPYTTPESGNEFLVVRLAVKNDTDDRFVNFSSLLQVRVTDDQDYAYEQAVTAQTDTPLVGGQLAPGEVIRGDLVFEVPSDAAGLSLEFDFQALSIVDFERVVVDLAESASSTQDVAQRLAVPVNSVGDAVTDSGTTVTVNGVETATELDSFTSASEGKEFAIVDVSVTNETGREQSVSILLQMFAKDGRGMPYTASLMAHSSLDQSFSQGTPIADGQTRRGKIAYEVPEGTSPLYWTFEFDVFASGDKTFWKLR